MGPETCVAPTLPIPLKNNNKQTNKNTTRIVYTGKKVRTPFLTMSFPKFSVKAEVAIVIFFSVISWSEPEQHSQSKQQRPKFLFSSYICKLLDNEDYDNLLTSVLSLKSLNRFQTNIKHLFGRKEKRRERKKKERKRKKEKRKG